MFIHMHVVEYNNIWGKKGGPQIKTEQGGRKGKEKML